MAIVNIPDKYLTIKSVPEIRKYLAELGIDYERWDMDEARISPDAAEAEILAAYAPEIEHLKQQGGYATADIINIVPTTPNLDVMLSKFSREHWHDEDEIRFIIKGHGVFHIAAKDSEVVSIEMEAGDLIRVPRGTRHWFNLCGDRTVRAIRLFQDISGWTPFYTESGLDANYQPLCFGANYITSSNSGSRKL